MIKALRNLVSRLSFPSWQPRVSGKKLRDPFKDPIELCSSARLATPDSNPQFRFFELRVRVPLAATAPAIAGMLGSAA
ncbi:hypothetical protein E4U54_007219 [Claviceps lovelessii]|nr:hypothetical protein E4U54_007219 [Claviceps lovelessii]